MQTKIKATLVSLASMIASPDAKAEPTELAKERGWLCENGHPTSEGVLIFHAIADQSRTRSVFRGLQ